MFHQKTSLATVVIITIVAVATLLLGALGVVNHVLESRAARAKFQEDLATNADQLAAGLALPAWNFDRAQIEHMVLSMMREPAVEGVVITLDDASAPGGVRELAWSRDEQWNPVPVAAQFAGASREQRDISASGSQLGQAQLFGSPRFLNASINQRLIRLVCMIVALAVILTVSLYLLLWRIVLKPVQSLSAFAAEVSSGAPSPQCRKGPHFYGELKGLRHSIEQMFRLLDARYKSLQESEARFRLLIEQAPPAILLSRDGVSVYGNSAFLRMMGLTGNEEVVDRPLEHWLTPECRVEVVERIRRRMEGLPVPNLFESVGLRADGTRFPFQVERKEVRIGEEIITVGFITDLSEQRRAQALMIESEKLRTVAGIAAGVAHEINNPLAGMVQNAQVILSRLTQDLAGNRDAAGRSGTRFEQVQQYVKEREIPELLESIRASGRQASQIVQNLLSYSRRPTRPSPVHLREIVERTLSLAASDYELKNGHSLAQVEIVRQYEADTPAVVCFSSQIQQVVINLIRNAVQAMQGNPPERAPRLTIRTFARDGFGCIEVSDNGPGVSPELRDRIFEPFFTTKREGEGTGLGLFVCQHIVTTEHRGKLEVTSPPGQGATFTIRLPMEQPENTE